MFLFSGTFFPISNLPTWAQLFARTLPLTHLVEICRSFALGQVSLTTLVGVVYLSIWSAILFPVALIGMRRRLIR
jgi:lipooligosaccharide transport system permease protein